MKTHSLIISSLCLAILIGCQTPQTTESEVSIMFDITGSSQNNDVDITTADIIDIFELWENPFNYGKLRITTLTDTHLSAIRQVKLNPVASRNDYNKYSRENETNKFVAQVDSLLFEVKNLDKGRQASSLFIPISREINRLALSKAENKVLIYFTDLFENSSTLFSVYSGQGLRKHLQDPTKLTELLSKNAPLPDDLNGVKVYLIYSPALDTDSDFMAISQWFKGVLETKGAEVYIGANLVIN